MTSTILQQCVDTAFKIFPNNITISREQLETLMGVINCLNMEELDTKPNYLSSNSLVHSKILDSKYFHFDIFYVKKGHRLPLHDHPGMVGIMKVLFGEMRVRSYSPQRQSGLRRTTFRTVLKCRKTQDRVYTASSKPIYLTSAKDNIHEVIAETDIAFFDCLAPPYENNCTFYRLSSGYDEADEMAELRSVGTEPEYVTAPRRYTGIPFRYPWHAT